MSRSYPWASWMIRPSQWDSPPAGRSPGVRISPISSSVAAKVVQRGQAVTLLADAGGISVRMAGRALSDGLMNQRVRVQNLSSGKIVEGIARSEQVVEIILQ